MNALVLVMVLVPGGSTSATFDCTEALPRVIGEEFETVSQTCSIVACPEALRGHLGTWRGSREDVSWDGRTESHPHELRYLHCVASTNDPTVYLYGVEGRPGGTKVPVARSERSRLKSFGHLVWGMNTAGCEPPNIYRERHERISTSMLGRVLEVETRQSMWSSSREKRVVQRERLVKASPRR